MFEIFVEIHHATLRKDARRTLGLLAGAYQFLEQYAVDKGDFYVAHFATHLPDPGSYPAPGRDEPVGKLLERDLAERLTRERKLAEANEMMQGLLNSLLQHINDLHQR